MTTYQITSEDTYVFLIKENISLVKKLINGSRRKATPFDPNDTPSFYKSRAKHLQTMALLGLTCEHLIKLIVLNRGFSILKIDYIKQVNDKSKIKYANRTISFNKTISLFKKSNRKDYFDVIKAYDFNPHDIKYEYSYMGYKKINPKTCINLIQKIRNNYIHKADSHGECNGIIWYIYNFIIWLAKKEFNNNFSKYRFIGNEEIISLFKNEK